MSRPKAEWQKLAEEKKQLLIGCGERSSPDYINLDIRDLPGVDVVCDATDGLPFEDDTFEGILM